MKRRVLTMVLALCMVLGMLPGTAWAASAAASGACGNITGYDPVSGNPVYSDNVVWELDSGGVLTISGTGAMLDGDPDSYYYYVPWYESNAAIQSVVVEDGVTGIGDYAFRDCTSLTSVTLPDSVASIGEYAFYGCGRLTGITIPDSVTSIGMYAFRDCVSLASAAISKGISNIEDYVFYNCSALTSVTVPDGVTSIGNGAFRECRGLTRVTIPASMAGIGDAAFNLCTALAEVYYSGTEAAWKAIDIRAYNDPLLSAAIHYEDEEEVPPVEVPTVTLDSGVKYVPYSWKPENPEGPYSVTNESLPNGLSVDGTTGEISGVPTASGSWIFTVSNGDTETVYMLTTANNTDSAVMQSNDYGLLSPVGEEAGQDRFILPQYEDQTLLIDGPYDEFMRLLLDGRELTRGTDYSAESGSTKITLYQDTFQAAGAGTHTIAAEFRAGGRPDGELRTASQNYTVQLQEPQPSAPITLDPGVRYVPYSWKPEDPEGPYSVAAGTLPNGLSVDAATGEILGVPMFPSSWTFTISNGEEETTYILTIVDNTNSAVQRPNGYDIIIPVGEEVSPDQFILYRYEDRVLLIDGPYDEFMRLLLDGRELTRGVDYFAEPGSTKITIYQKTFENTGTGTHTIAAEFRTGGKSDGELRTVSQNYTVQLQTPTKPSTPSSGSSGSSSSSGNKKKPSSSSSSSKPSTTTTTTAPAAPAADPAPTGLPFGDIAANSWYYEDVRWAYEGGVMTGMTASSFAPNQDISQATIVTVLARLGQIDLSRFETAQDSTIESGKWYTTAAIWAKQSGILPDYSTFTGEETISRDQMAVMLVKYLRSIGKDTNAPAQTVTFADAEQMSQDGNTAFQVLYQYNIFRGVGENCMDPLGGTTRAQFAALMHRISNL